MGSELFRDRVRTVRDGSREIEAVSSALRRGRLGPRLPDPNYRSCRSPGPERHEATSETAYLIPDKERIS